jgi:glycosyltransferase involved in cell wall biosynthesis
MNLIGQPIAHIIPYTGTALGGPVNGMAGYVGLLAEAGYSITVYSARKTTDGDSVRLDPKVRHVQESAAGWGSFRRSAALWRHAQEADIALLHSHGLWTDVNRLAGNLARRRSLPHMLAPCGMLAPGALRHHRWKKVPVRFWFQNRALRAAQCLHAKSLQEYEHIRRFGLHNPVAIIANPIALPPDTARMSEEDFRCSHQIPANRKIVLFLGRLHQVKGLARLVQAWAMIQGKTATSVPLKIRNWDSKRLKSENWGQRTGEWVLVLAGPDEGGYRREVESLMVKLGCGGNVVLTGKLADNQKWGALAAADLFVMPSDFENFGNALVEAMSCAVPVITTTGTPWEELRTAGAGWWVEPTVAALSGALREAMAMSDDQRRAMGHRASPLAEQFRPGRVAEHLIQVYQWLLCGAARPPCVKVD